MPITDEEAASFLSSRQPSVSGSGSGDAPWTVQQLNQQIGGNVAQAQPIGASTPQPVAKPSPAQPAGISEEEAAQFLSAKAPPAQPVTGAGAPTWPTDDEVFKMVKKLPKTKFTKEDTKRTDEIAARNAQELQDQTGEGSLGAALGASQSPDLGKQVWGRIQEDQGPISNIIKYGVKVGKDAGDAAGEVAQAVGEPRKFSDIIGAGLAGAGKGVASVAEPLVGAYHDMDVATDPSFLNAEKGGMPTPPTYNQWINKVTGGRGTINDVLDQVKQKKYGANPGAYNLAQDITGAFAIPGLNPAENATLQGMAKAFPALAQKLGPIIMHGIAAAGVGGVAGGVQQMATNQTQGQPLMQGVPESAGTMAVIGGGLGALKGAAQAKAPAPLPEQQLTPRQAASQSPWAQQGAPALKTAPQEEYGPPTMKGPPSPPSDAEIRQQFEPYRTPQKTFGDILGRNRNVMGRVAKTAPQEEYGNALFDPYHAPARRFSDVLGKERNVNQSPLAPTPEVPKKVAEIKPKKASAAKAKTTLEGRVEEVAPAKSQAPPALAKVEDFNPAGPGEAPREAISPEAKALHDELGIEPPEEDIDEPLIGNRHKKRMRVPIAEIKEAEGEGSKTRYTKDYDPKDRTIRVVKHGKRLHVAKPHAEEGYVELGRIVDKGSASKGSKGAAYVAAAAEDLKNNKNMASRIRLNDAEGLDEHYDTLPKHQQEVLDAIQENNQKAAERAAEGKTPMQKLGAIMNPGVTYLQIPSTTQILGALSTFSKGSGKDLISSMRYQIGLGKKVFLEHAAALDDLGIIAEQAGAHGDNALHAQLVGNLAKEAEVTRNLDEGGPLGDEYHDALRYQTPSQILKGHANWTPEARKAVAARKIIRMHSKSLIKKVLEKHDEYGGEIDEEYERALEEYGQRQTGTLYQGKRGNTEKYVDAVQGNVFKGIFKYNIPVKMLQLTHTIQLAPVSGVRNIGAAYWKLVTDKKMRGYIGSFKTVTTSARRQMNEEYRQQARIENDLSNIDKKEPFEADFSTDKINNSVFLLAGMRKKAIELYGNKADEMLNKLADDKLPKDEAYELIGQGIMDINEATGGGTFGMNRMQIQRSPVLRAFAQLSTYKHLVYRYHVKQIRAAAKAMNEGDYETARKAIKNLLVTTGAAILLGGRAPVAGWLQQEALEHTVGPEATYQLDKLLDSLNVPARFGVNLTHHMEYTPLNYGTSLSLEEIATLKRDVAAFGKPSADKSDAEKWINLVGDVLMITTPIGGEAMVEKVARGVGNLKRQYKVVHPAGSPKRYLRYNTEDFIRSILTAGEGNKDANVREQANVIRRAKETHTRVPRSLEHDYPTH